MEGTCTGEHGVGYGKVHFLHVEHDTETMAMMRRIKDAMDPLGLMNPGKVLSR
jgi:D-lactate dehydrogenase (cytochrome)